MSVWPRAMGEWRIDRRECLPGKKNRSWKTRQLGNVWPSPGCRGVWVLSSRHALRAVAAATKSAAEPILVAAVSLLLLRHTDPAAGCPGAYYITPEGTAGMEPRTLLIKSQVRWRRSDGGWSRNYQWRP